MRVLSRGELFTGGSPKHVQDDGTILNSAIFFQWHAWISGLVLFASRSCMTRTNLCTTRTLTRETRSKHHFLLHVWHWASCSDVIFSIPYFSSASSHIIFASESKTSILLFKSNNSNNNPNNQTSKQRYDTTLLLSFRSFVSSLRCAASLSPLFSKNKNQSRCLCRQPDHHSRGRFQRGARQSVFEVSVPGVYTLQQSNLPFLY
jgi:hypothetical protein